MNHFISGTAHFGSAIMYGMASVGIDRELQQSIISFIRKEWIG